MGETKLPDLTAINLIVRNGITLRNFKNEDADAIYATVSRNARHLHFMQWCTPNYSADSAREFVERSIANAASGESLSLALLSEGSFIGSIGFVKFDVESRRTEIGYWIDSGFEGKGIIADAARVLIRFAFTTLNMNRIEIHCLAENERSAAVARRLGFTQDAHLREYEWRNGRPYDYLTFGLIRSDPAGVPLTATRLENNT